jgi:hypothetical protein
MNFIYFFCCTLMIIIGVCNIFITLTFFQLYSHTYPIFNQSNLIFDMLFYLFLYLKVIFLIEVRIFIYFHFFPLYYSTFLI